MKYAESDLGKDSLLARDYSSIVNYGLKKISQWSPEWTDFTITDPGVLYVSAIAYLFDHLNYQLDEKYLNSILRYSYILDELYGIADFNGIELDGTRSARAVVDVTVSGNITRHSVYIPRFTEFIIVDNQTQEMQTFTTLQDASIKNYNGKFLGVEGDLHFVSNKDDNGTLVPIKYKDFYYENALGEKIHNQIKLPSFGIDGSPFLIDQDSIMVEVMRGNEVIISYDVMKKVRDIATQFMTSKTMKEDRSFSVNFQDGSIFVKISPVLARVLNPDDTILVYFVKSNGDNQSVSENSHVELRNPLFYEYNPTLTYLRLEQHESFIHEKGEDGLDTDNNIFYVGKDVGIYLRALQLEDLNERAQIVASLKKYSVVNTSDITFKVTHVMNGKTQYFDTKLRNFIGANLLKEETITCSDFDKYNMISEIDGLHNISLFWGGEHKDKLTIAYISHDSYDKAFLHQNIIDYMDSRTLSSVQYDATSEENKLVIKEATVRTFSMSLVIRMKINVYDTEVFKKEVQEYCYEQFNRYNIDIGKDFNRREFTDAFLNKFKNVLRVSINLPFSDIQVENDQVLELVDCKVSLL